MSRALLRAWWNMLRDRELFRTNELGARHHFVGSELSIGDARYLITRHRVAVTTPWPTIVVYGLPVRSGGSWTGESVAEERRGKRYVFDGNEWLRVMPDGQRLHRKDEPTELTPTVGLPRPPLTREVSSSTGDAPLEAPPASSTSEDLA